MQTKKEEELKEKTMKLSIKEGSSCSVMTGLGDYFVVPFATKVLNSSNFQIGILNGLSSLLPPLFQILGSKMMEKYTRKKIIMLFVALQALMWLPILLLSLLLWKNIFVEYLPAVLIIFYTIYAIFGAIAGPAWFSLMGDIVPEDRRGKYFGKRSRITNFVLILSTLIGGFLLDYFTTQGLILVGFSIFFFLACVFRLYSARLFSKHYEPKLKLEKGYYFNFWQFIKKAPSTNYGKFVIFVALFYIGVMIGGPFISVYMLKDLNFSFTTFMIVNMSASIFTLLFVPIWGKFADKYGNKQLLKIGSFLVGIMPILWIFSGNQFYLIFVPQLISGIGWAAFNLGASNFIYDSVSIPKRALCLAYYNITVGICIFIGSSIGGVLAKYLSFDLVNTFFVLFIISGIVRLAFSVIMIGKIQEERKVVKVSKNFIRYLREIAPISGLVAEIFGDVKEMEREIKKI